MPNTQGKCRLLPAKDGAFCCPFCDQPADRVLLQEERVFGLWDGYTVAPGHAAGHYSSIRIVSF